MPEILVTGGAGFIGSELVAQLAAVMPRGGTVFHLACLGVRHSLRAPRENHEINATGTLAVLDAARAAGVARFVHVSSSEIYGPARTAPMAEEHPAFPPTVYGASKLAGESYARAAFATHGFPVVVVRPFNACASSPIGTADAARHPGHCWKARSRETGRRRRRDYECRTESKRHGERHCGFAGAPRAAKLQTSNAQRQRISTLARSVVWTLSVEPPAGPRPC